MDVWDWISAAVLAGGLGRELNAWRRACSVARRRKIANKPTVRVTVEVIVGPEEPDDDQSPGAS